MNQSLHGPNIMLIDVSEKPLAFREKLKLGKRKIVSETASFPVFNQFVEDMEEVCFGFQLVIKKHLTSLIQEFDLIIPKKQKNWNGCATHLLLMLIHCRKAAKLFLDFKRNLLTFSTTVYWGMPLRNKTLDKNREWKEYCWYARSKSSTAICYYLLVWVWVFCACTHQNKDEELPWAWRRHEIDSEQDCSKFWQSCGNDTKSGLTLIKFELLLWLRLGLC